MMGRRIESVVNEHIFEHASAASSDVPSAHCAAGVRMPGRGADDAIARVSKPEASVLTNARLYSYQLSASTRRLGLRTHTNRLSQKPSGTAFEPLEMHIQRLYSLDSCIAVVFERKSLHKNLGQETVSRDGFTNPSTTAKDLWQRRRGGVGDIRELLAALDSGWRELTDK